MAIWFRKTFHDYVVFTKSILFILGLILSYKLVEKTFLNILITYLVDAWKVYDLRKAVVIVNLLEGTGAVLVPFFVYAADVYTGRFGMVVSSTAVCIIVSSHEESQPTPIAMSYRDKFHYYTGFTTSIFFILGLMLSYNLVEKTFLNILITHLAVAWKKYDLRSAIIVVNLREGTSSVLLPLFYYIAKVHTGRFRMVIFSTAVCIIGLFLNFMATRNEDGLLDLRLFYTSLLLIALAQAAKRITLIAFLADQLKDSDDDTARRRRIIFWLILVSVVSIIFALFGPLPGLEFRKLVLLLTIVMGGFFLLFLLGTKYYTFVARAENPFKDVGTVINTAIDKRKVEYPKTQGGYFEPTPEGLFDRDSSGDLQILPPVPRLRWLDKAAIITDIAQPGPPSVEQVRKVKFLLKLLPLWSCFLIFSLVVGSGITFFLEEATSLVADDDLRPMIFLNILVTFTEAVVAATYENIIKKLGEGTQYNKQKMELVRVGIGISCCVPCCITAWATAARRQHDNEEGKQMSVYLLAPQFMLLGLMGGLARKGLESFYESQVPETLSRYAMPFGEFMMGVGKFLSIVCILIFGRSRFKWFQRELKNSRLDKYYIFLAVLSFGSFIIYCLVARWYGDDAFLLGDGFDDEEMAIINQADGLINEGLASRSLTGPGQPVYHQSLSHRHRTESVSGDIITESSSSKQEQEEETPEEPLLANKKKSKYINVLSSVTMFMSIFSRVTGKRSDS